MDIWTVIRITVGRWYLSLPILLMCLGLGIVIASSHETPYSATSSAILTGPSIVRAASGGKFEKINPLLNLGGSLNATTEAITNLMDSQPKRSEFQERGVSPDYTVDRLESIITFKVTGPDPESVVVDANKLVKFADIEALRLQGESNVDAAPATRVRVIALAIPQVAAPDGAAAAKTLTAAGVLGVLAAIASAIALDGFLRWRAPGRGGVGANYVGRAPYTVKFATAKVQRVKTPEAPEGGSSS